MHTQPWSSSCLLYTSKAQYLRELELHDYQPASIQLTDLPHLVMLRLHDNQLTEIQLSGMPLLNLLSCYGNKLTVEAGKKIIASLPKRLEEEKATILWLNSQGKGADNAFQEGLLYLCLLYTSRTRRRSASRSSLTVPRATRWM